MTMEFGKIEYTCTSRKDGYARRRRLRLTLIGLDDKKVLERHGVRALRLNRVIRLTREAREQGCLLGYDDLAALLLTSIATLKRDVSHIEKNGQAVHLKGRKRYGCHALPPDGHEEVISAADLASTAQGVAVS